MDNTNGLENQNVRFYLNAPSNSPIWGTAQDMSIWLADWHARGCPIQPTEKALEVMEREDQAKFVRASRYRAQAKHRKEMAEA